MFACEKSSRLYKKQFYVEFESLSFTFNDAEDKAISEI
jgi:hypothetical protein